jgi:hypothetical protein
MNLAEGCIFVLQEKKDELDGENDPPLYDTPAGAWPLAMSISTTLSYIYLTLYTRKY